MKRTYDWMNFMISVSKFLTEVLRSLTHMCHILRSDSYSEPKKDFSDEFEFPARQVYFCFCLHSSRASFRDGFSTSVLNFLPVDNFCLVTPIQWDDIIDMENLSKSVPMISWKEYLAFLRIQQGLHEQDQPEVVFDEIASLQPDETSASDKLEAFKRGTKIGNGHLSDVSCFPHAYKLE